MTYFRQKKLLATRVLEAIRHDVQDESVYERDPIVKRLRANLECLKEIFRDAEDMTFYEFTLYDMREAAVVYTSGLTDVKRISTDILSPLTERKAAQRGKLDIRSLTKSYTDIPDVKRIFTVGRVVKYVLSGYAVLLVEGEEEAAALKVVNQIDRAIEQPDTEAVIRGPREGFNENLETSLSLIRRRLPTPDLKIERLVIGLYTQTDVALCYIKGIADPDLIREARIRLERIEMDGVLDSGYLEEQIEDNPFSPFPQILNTERPDVVTAGLLEGKFAILTNGSPIALIAPLNLWSALQASEDYYERYMIVTLIRLLRYLFLNFALILPALYVAITTFHQEMLPTKLLFSVAAAREVTPLPAMMEALIMELSFEALREAGVRLPKQIGSAITIVGALVIGQAAVEAGMASAPLVIIVSITGIASFVIPRFNFAISIRILRFPLIILAGMFGLFGLVWGIIAIAIHLTTLRSFGRPYLEPVTPFNGQGVLDTFIRAPRWAMEKRPLSVTVKDNQRRQTDATRPENRLPK